MEKPLPKKKSNLLTWAVITIIAILFVSIVLYRTYMEVPEKTSLDDPENDVILSVGTEYPGMIDVVKAALEVNEKALNITINMRDPISDLDEGESAQWNITIILENELKAYELYAQMNSTKLEGYLVEIGEWKPKACQIEHHKNSLTIITSIDELQTAKEVQWFILTTFERSSENKIIISGSDTAPDEGLQRTILKG